MRSFDVIKRKVTDYYAKIDLQQRMTLIYNNGAFAVARKFPILCCHYKMKLLNFVTDTIFFIWLIN